MQINIIIKNATLLFCCILKFDTVCLSQISTKIIKPDTKPALKQPEKGTSVYDSVYRHWTEASINTGAKRENTITDSKGNFFCYYSSYPSADSTVVYKLENSKWESLGKMKFVKFCRLFIDAEDHLFALTANAVYKFSEQEWRQVWKVNIPECTEAWIALDGNLYRKSWIPFDSELFKWDGENWKSVCKAYMKVYIDRNGKVYASDMYYEQTKKVPITCWNGTEWKSIGEETGITEMWIGRENLYALFNIRTKDSLNEYKYTFHSELKKWDGRQWSKISLPQHGEIKECQIDQFENISFVMQGRRYYSTNQINFKEINYGSGLYGFSYLPIIANNKPYDVNDRYLYEYKPSWKVTAAELFPIPVKPGTKNSAELEYKLKNWKIYKGAFGYGIRTLNNRIVIYPHFDSIRIESSPGQNAKGYAFYLKNGYQGILCSADIDINDPLTILEGYGEKDGGDCAFCTDGTKPGTSRVIETKGDYVPGSKRVTKTPRSSGGYTITETTSAGYYKPSTYETKVTPGKGRCTNFGCKGGRIMLKQKWKLQSSYTEFFEK